MASSLSKLILMYDDCLIMSQTLSQVHSKNVFELVFKTTKVNNPCIQLSKIVHVAESILHLTGT